MEHRIEIRKVMGAVLLTRSAGRKLRSLMITELESDGSLNLILDFAGVESVSSTFADESLGKLDRFLQNPEDVKRIEIVNAGKGAFSAIRLAQKGQTRPGVSNSASPGK